MAGFPNARFIAIAISTVTTSVIEKRPTLCFNSFLEKSKPLQYQKVGKPS
jgi:hypothetical protein